MIADNQLALNAGWDDDLLRAELAALQDDDFNVRLIGSEDEELARSLAASGDTKDPKYADRIVRRYQEYTGRQGVLIRSMKSC